MIMVLETDICWTRNWLECLILVQRRWKIIWKEKYNNLLKIFIKYEHKCINLAKITYEFWTLRTCLETNYNWTTK